MSVERTRLTFQPTAVLQPSTSPITGGQVQSRRTTTDEQRAQAVRHAAEWMAERKVWTVDVEVHWTRTEATVLTVSGHAEHLGDRVVPAVDRVRERALDGRAIEQTAAERHMTLEREVAEVYAEGLD